MRSTVIFNLPINAAAYLPHRIRLESISPGDTNKHRYVIASQSQPLRQTLRQIPAVPLVHVNRAVMILEPPSEKTKEMKEKASSGPLSHTTAQLIVFLRRQSDEAKLLPPEPIPLPASVAGPSTSVDTGTHPVKKKKGPKGPNPLSVKKKKAVDSGRKGDSSDKKGGKGKEREKEKVEIGKKRRREEEIQSDSTPAKRIAFASAASPTSVNTAKSTVPVAVVSEMIVGTGVDASAVIIARRGRKRNRKRNKGKGTEGGAEGGENTGGEGSEGDE